MAQQRIKEDTVDQIIDPTLIRGQILPNSLKAFMQIAEQCLHNRAKQCPNMAEVVVWLEFTLALQENANSSKCEGETINTGGAYDNQENADSSTEVELTDSSSHHNVKIDEISRSGLSDLQMNLFSLCFELTSLSRWEDIGWQKCCFLAAEGDSEDLPGQTKRVYLRELQVATDNFSKLNILGRGWSGKVYKRRLSDGSFVAVKRVMECVGALMFQKHIEIISMAVHPNILPFIGYCMTETKRFLVYPFMANGSLASCLRERSGSMRSLTWQIRKRIALGSARGLAYLHGHNKPNVLDAKIINRDVKAPNIFLNEEFEAVVGGFWIAKLMDYQDSHVDTAVRGTIGHIAPEYLSTGKCSEKTDVYGYGAMLLELVTGQRAFNLARLAKNDDVMLLDWCRPPSLTNCLNCLKLSGKSTLEGKEVGNLVDVELLGNYAEEEVEQLIQVCLLCTQDSLMERPKMSEVIRVLDGDNLAERWELLEHEILCNQSNTFHQNLDQTIADSINNPLPEELSGPRLSFDGSCTGISPIDFNPLVCCAYGTHAFPEFAFMIRVVSDSICW
ncbi:hypothetical protein RJ640_002832 [Escallonia rubra]|uniref:non-specific serine/threonine protein kinase n=1 Tax=Escallonia rubra TaxID=112253 RepID=A0AA88RQ81_9ASTE|nr:hypothetical protein RJ640_002832 [Escallonia rubra]